MPNKQGGSFTLEFYLQIDKNNCTVFYHFIQAILGHLAYAFLTIIMLLWHLRILGIHNKNVNLFTSEKPNLLKIEIIIINCIGIRFILLVVVVNIFLPCIKY